MLLELTTTTFENEVLKSELPVLVDFWAPWCGPCRMMGPILEELATELEGKIKVMKVNVDSAENQELASRYDIQGIPAMKVFTGGEITAEFVGLRDKASLKNDLLAKV